MIQIGLKLDIQEPILRGVSPTESIIFNAIAQCTYRETQQTSDGNRLKATTALLHWLPEEVR